MTIHVEVLVKFETGHSATLEGNVNGVDVPDCLINTMGLASQYCHRIVGRVYSIRVTSYECNPTYTGGSYLG